MKSVAVRSSAMWLVILLLAGGTTFPVAARADQADDDYRLATQLYRKGRWKLAGEAFHAFVKKHPQHRLVPFARLYRGVSLENQEKYREARDVLRSFVKDYPRNSNRTDALFRVGECSYFLNDLKAAESELQAFLKSAPKHEFAEFALPYLGDVQYRLKKPRAAAATFEEALKRYPNGRMVDESRFGLARCLARLNQPDKALKLYFQLAGQPATEYAASAQMEAGLLLFRLKKYDEAVAAFAAFEKRFAKHPSRFQAFLNAGAVAFEKKEYDRAAEWFDKAAGNAALRPAARYWQGVSLKAAGHYEKAVAVLKQEFERDAQSERAPGILFEWATCERLQQHFGDARRLYLNLVQRWPKNDDAEEALYLAGEMALLDGRPEVAQQDVDRLRQEYPQTKLWAYRDLLQARILAEKKDRAGHTAAVSLLKNVLSKSEEQRAQRLARFHLVRVYRLLGQHEQALQTAEPLLQTVKKEGAGSEFIDVYLMAARSQLAGKRYDDAIRTATQYLQWRPEKEKAVVALAVRCEAALRSGKAEQQTQWEKDADRLVTEFKADPLSGATLHRLAEWAYEQKRWQTAATLFSRLLKLGKESPYHGPALSGLGWAQFEQKKYEEAAKTFGQLLTDHPDDLLLASQAAFKQAECSEKLLQPEKAAAHYLSAFHRFAPEQPAAAGSEQPGRKFYYVYHSGLRAARLLARQKKIAQADATYEKLLEKFPRPAALDRRLDEWALVNYNAGRYERSDAIFRRLIREVPDSPLVDNARYSLAESDLNAGKIEAAEKVFADLYASPKSDAVVKEVSLYRLFGIALEREEWKTARERAAVFRKAFPKSEHRWYAAFVEAEARFRLKDLPGALRILQMLRGEQSNGTVATAEWYPRVWLLLAEVAVRQSRYRDVVQLVQEAKIRFDKWPQLYLMDEVLGRCYKRQALFQKARTAFQRVVQNKEAHGTETAAKCQFLIAETHLMQDDYKLAREAYFRVDALYEYPAWQAPALYMAGQCDEKLKDYAGAAKTYEDLIRRFPKSTYAAKAKPRLVAARQKAGRH